MAIFSARNSQVTKNSAVSVHGKVFLCAELFSQVFRTTGCQIGDENISPRKLSRSA